MSTIYTQADLDAIDQALLDRKGARSLTIGDRNVTFDSYADILAFRAQVAAAINGRNGRTRYASTSKGI